MRKRKTILAVVLTIVAVLTCGFGNITYASIEKTANVIVNDEAISFKKQPFIENGCCFVPVEEICEYLNAQIIGDNYETGVYISLGKEKIQIQKDNLLAKYNGKSVQLPEAPIYKNDTLYIPLEVFQEAFGYKLDYNLSKNSVSLSREIILRTGANDVALTSLTLDGKYGGLKYEKEKNNANTKSTGIDYISGRSDFQGRLYYRFDASALADLKVQKAKLVFYASRNWGGDPTFSIYKITGEWNPETVNYNNIPKTENAPSVQKTYTRSGTNVIAETTYTMIEMDITPLLAGISEDNPFVSFMLTSNAYSETFATAVKGVGTTQAPYITVQALVDGNYTTKKPVSVTDDSKYDFDPFVLLAKLGIFKPEDEFSDDKNEIISRAEFAAYATRLLNVDAGKGGEMIFADIKEDNYYYSDILAALQFGVISPDDMFRPNDGITYNEAAAMLINVLGCRTVAEYKGGYPNGFLSVARKCGLFDDTEYGGGDIGVSYADAYMMLYNALIAPRYTSLYNNDFEFSKTENLLKINFGAYFVEGVVTGNKFTNLFDDTENGDKIIIDKTSYNVKNNDIFNLLGFCVKALCIESAHGDDTVIYAGAEKNNTLIVDASDISSASEKDEQIEFVYETAGRKQKKISIDKDMSIIYNGCAIDKNRDFKAELFSPDMGNIKFVDNDADADYDVVLITRYTDVFVSVIDRDNAVAYDKYKNSRKIEFNPDSEDEYTTIVDMEGNEYSYTDIMVNDVLSAAISRNNRVKTIYLSRKTITGKIESIGKTSSDTDSVVINGTTVKRSERNKDTDIYLGLEGTFYIDSFGYIAGVRERSSELTAGYVAGISSDGGLEDNVNLYIFTSGTDDGEIPKFICADKVTFDGEKVGKDVVYSFFNNGGEINRQVIFFKVNSKGRVVYIDTVNEGANENGDTLVKRYDSESGMLKNKSPYLGGKYIINSGTFMVSLPDDPEDEENYVQVNSIGADRKVTCDIFTLGSDALAADVVILKDYGSGAGLGVNNIIGVVKRKIVSYDENETFKKLVVCVNGKDIDVKVEKKDYELIDDISDGDVIRYSANLRGYLKAVKKYYDSSRKEIVGSTGMFDDEVHVFGGFAYIKENGYAKIVTDYNDVSDNSAMVFDLESAQSVMYKDDLSGREITVRKASYDDIVDYKSGRNSATGIICQVMYGNQYKAVILVDIGKYSESDEILDDDGENDVQLVLTDGENIKTYKKTPGSVITLPAKTFLKPFSVLYGWTDGIREYMSGTEYTIPEDGAVLTALWESSPGYTLPVSSGNAALTDSKNPESNMIDLTSGGSDAIISKSDDSKSLWYKADSNGITDKDIASAKLILHINRNWGGAASVLRVYEVKEEWDADTICYDSKPPVGSKIAEVSLSSMSDTYYKKVEVDVTDYIKSLADGAPINIMINTSSAQNSGISVMGTASGSAPYFEFALSDPKTLYFEGSDADGGETESVTVNMGTTVSLPECGYTKTGYDFAGWSDGMNIYEAGDDYLVNGDTTFTALWEFSGVYEFKINEGGAALITTDASGNFTSLGYTQSKNNINLETDGTDSLNARFNGRLIYRIDAGELADKNIESAYLTLSAMRNFAGNPTFSVYCVTGEWNSEDISGQNAPSYDETPICTKTYKNSGSENLIFDSEYTEVVLDITSAAKNITAENPYICVMVTSGVISGSSCTLIKGINSKDAPKISVNAK